MRTLHRPKRLRRFDPLGRRRFNPQALTGDGRVGMLTVQTAAGTSFGGFTTAKSVINTGSIVTLSPNFWVVGKTLRITVAGALSNIVTTPGLVVFQVVGGPTSNIVLFTTGNIQLNATAHTTLPFWLNILLRCSTIGSGTAATLMGMGRLQGIQPTITAAQVDAVNTGGIFSAPPTVPAVGTGFDSTVLTKLDFFAGFTISDPNNSVLIQHYLVEDLN